MEKKKNICNERHFLNLQGKHSVGAIQALTYLSSFKEDKPLNEDIDYDHVFSELTIGDCSKSITISIDIDDLEGYTNTVYKLKTMIETLKKFEKSVHYAYELQKQITERRIEDYKKEKEESKKENKSQ